MILTPRVRLAMMLVVSSLSRRASAEVSEHGSLRLANYAGYERDGSSVTISTSGEAKLRLEVAAPDVVRVWLAPSGLFRKDRSYSVIQEKWNRVPLEVADKGTYLSIKTPRLALRVYKAPVSLDFYQVDDKTPISQDDPAHGMEWYENKSLLISRQLETSEHFYGLGQDNSVYRGTLDRRGTRRVLWTGQQINHGKVTAEIPIPFLLSTGAAGGGYGLFFDNTYRTEFDLGASSHGSYSWHADGGEALYYFIYGPSFAQIVERYTWLTGRPSLPNLWTLGYIQSKCTYYKWEDIDEMLQTMRAKSIPVDGVAIDFDWPQQLQNFQWNSRWDNESPARLAEYGSRGLNFLLSQSGPMIRKDSSNYQDGLSHGIFARDGHGQPLTCGYYGGDLMDFTAPQMKSWLWPQIKHLHEEGIKGWWLDLTEPEGEPPQTIYHDGPAAKIHNVFSMLTSKTYYDMLKAADPDARVFLLTRTGFAGIQKYGAALWTGDIYSDYETLEAQVPAALNAGLSGITAWTNDSGGFLEGYYKNSLAAHGLLYERWLQFSAFAPITRAHHVGLSEPYAFGPEVEAGSRHYLQLRYQLLPYIYSYAWHTHRTGAPFVRPLIFDYQNDPNVTNLKDEFLFGKEILVAPVLTEQATSRSVYVPPGTWFGYEDGVEYQGGKSYNVPAPQHRIPLFVKSGAIIPMAPPMLNTAEKPWDPLTIDIYPDGLTDFTLYADDGKTMAFESRASYTETRLRSLLHGQQEILSITANNHNFLPETYACRFHLQATPTSAFADGYRLTVYPTLRDYAQQRQGAYWDQASQTLYAKFASGHYPEHQLEVTLAGDHLGRTQAER